MPDRTITYLSVASVTLFAGYVALVAVTIFFASIRTELAAEARELESTVAALETEYYDAISELSAVDVALSGYVTPHSVEYVAKHGTAAVTRAGN